MKVKKKQEQQIEQDTPLSVLQEIKYLIDYRYEGSTNPCHLADRFERMLDEIEHSIKKIIK